MNSGFKIRFATLYSESLYTTDSALKIAHILPQIGGGGGNRGEGEHKEVGEGYIR